MANDFKPSVGTQISKVEAKKQIEKFDKERKKDTTSVFFGREAIEATLRIPGCAGISFFFSRKDVDDMVMVGTKEDGTLLWTDAPPIESAKDGGSQTFNVAITCPPYCPK